MNEDSTFSSLSKKTSAKAERLETTFQNGLQNIEESLQKHLIDVESANSKNLNQLRKERRRLPLKIWLSTLLSAVIVSLTMIGTLYLARSKITDSRLKEMQSQIAQLQSDKNEMIEIWNTHMMEVDGKMHAIYPRGLDIAKDGKNNEYAKIKTKSGFKLIQIEE